MKPRKRPGEEGSVANKLCLPCEGLVPETSVAVEELRGVSITVGSGLSSFLPSNSSASSALYIDAQFFL